MIHSTSFPQLCFTILFLNLVDSNLLQPPQKIHQNDSFGASLAIYGTNLLCGASGVSRSDGSGVVFVYQYFGGSDIWEEVEQLTPQRNVPGYNFGLSVALDGATAVIGADQNPTPSSPGQVYIYVHIGRSWSEQGVLLPPTEDDGMGFGRAVSVYNKTVLIGASGTSNGQGVAYVYVHTPTPPFWILKAKLTNPYNPRNYSFFGCSVSIYGGMALIGGCGARDSGGVFLFQRNSEDGWEMMEQILPPDFKEGQEFGYSVSLYGYTAVIGSPMNLEGMVYVYRYNGITWDFEHQFPSFNDILLPNTSFGHSVALWGDILITGTPGAAYVYTRVAGVNGLPIWVSQKIIFPPTENLEGFGDLVAIYNGTVVVGSGGGVGPVFIGDHMFDCKELYFGCEDDVIIVPNPVSVPKLDWLPYVFLFLILVSLLIIGMTGWVFYKRRKIRKDLEKEFQIRKAEQKGADSDELSIDEVKGGGHVEVNQILDSSSEDSDKEQGSMKVVS